MKFRVVVLAAGKGKRMKSELPKTLTLVNGKPILGYVLEAIRVSGMDTQPVIVVGHGREHICDAFGQQCQYAIQEEQLGTGHALRCAKEQASDADAVMVLYGDHPFISAESITRLAEEHAQKQNTLTMMTVTVPSFEGWYQAFLNMGRIVRDVNGALVGIREYKDASEETRAIQEVNPALFCFDAAWMWAQLDALKNENAQGEYYLTDLVAMAFEQGKSISTIPLAPEEAIGINSPEERELAERLTTGNV